MLPTGRMDLLDDQHTMGLVFENLCVRDLRVYAQALGGAACTTTATETASSATRSCTSKASQSLTPCVH